jgi:hypothetical protein
MTNFNIDHAYGKYTGRGNRQIWMYTKSQTNIVRPALFDNLGRISYDNIVPLIKHEQYMEKQES